jgi:hypothetical protein
MRLSLLLVVTLWSILGVSTTDPIPKHITILNKSGTRLQVLWVSPTGQQVPFSDVYNGARMGVDSFVNHTFIVRQMNVESKQSRIGYLTVDSSDSQG